MDYFETFTFQQLSFIYKSRIDRFVIGDEDDDLIIGGEGNEMLIGGAGDDVLVGDVLTGGEGSDRFVYNPFDSSRDDTIDISPYRDIITDFSSSEGDKIDLSAIAEDFVFIGSSDFTGTRNEVRFDDGVLQISVSFEPDTAPTPVFEIQLLGVNTFGFEDLLLGDNTFGFEDLLLSDLSDWDHNDFVVQIS